jgi:hypothetical protein
VIDGAIDYTGGMNIGQEFGDIGAAGRFEHFEHGALGYTFDAEWSPQQQSRFVRSGFGTTSRLRKR